MLEGTQLIVLKHLYVSRMCMLTFTFYLFVLSPTFPLNFIGWYPWGFLQCLQKKWSAADVWHMFPRVSSGLLRPASENNSQGHVDLSQMSGPGTVGAQAGCGPWRKATQSTGLPFPSNLGNDGASSLSWWFSGPPLPCPRHNTNPQSVHPLRGSVTVMRQWLCVQMGQDPNCFCLFEMIYLLMYLGPSKSLRLSASCSQEWSKPSMWFWNSGKYSPWMKVLS